MAGETYILDAARQVTTAALDYGKKPSVISAIVKYELTERMRRIVNDGMDIQGGSGICMGPRNYLARFYEVIPISITVEGANILTRTMIIFGQGAIRCHPFIQKEMAALQQEPSKQALQQFDEILFRHIGFFLHNMAASFWLGLTNGCFLRVPGNRMTKRYYRRIARLSADFALVADFALFSLGGSLKRRERISGRFADVLSNLYLCSCVLKHYHDQDCPADDAPLLDWACRHTLHRAQQSLLAVLWKLPMPPIAMLLRMITFPTGKRYGPPSDKLAHKTASVLLADTPARDRLTDGIYINDKADDATGRIEVAFKAILAAAPVEAKIRAAQLHKQLSKGEQSKVVAEALAKGIIVRHEADLIAAAEQARLAAISVDDFSPEELTGRFKQV
jgi:acyl-CoA dehydrogenase